MTTIVKYSQLSPLVLLNVVELTLLGGSVNIFARPGNQDVRVADGTSRMSMAWILHFCLRNTIIRLSLGSANKFVSLIHGCWSQIKVATPDHVSKRVTSTNLNKLKIVGEVILCILSWLGRVAVTWDIVDLVLAESKVLSQCENSLAVFVENINNVWGFRGRRFKGCYLSR